MCVLDLQGKKDVVSMHMAAAGFESLSEGPLSKLLQHFVLDLQERPASFN